MALCHFLNVDVTLPSHASSSPTYTQACVDTMDLCHLGLTSISLQPRGLWRKTGVELQDYQGSLVVGAFEGEILWQLLETMDLHSRKMTPWFCWPTWFCWLRSRAPLCWGTCPQLPLFGFG
jgi:hypothetical protein